MRKSSGRGKENFTLRGILIPFDVRLRVLQLYASLYIFPTPHSSLSRDAVWIPCRIWRLLPFFPHTPIADSMKVRITCASAPIRLRSWNNRLQRALRPLTVLSQMKLLLALRDGTCDREVSVRQNFSTYSRRSISHIYNAAVVLSDVRSLTYVCIKFIL